MVNKLSFVIILLGLAGAMAPSAFAQEASSTNALVSLLNIPLCPDVFATSPENPAFIGPNDATRFAWSGEPVGTARRDFVAFDNFPQPDDTFLSSGNLTIEAATPLEHTTMLSQGNSLPGTYNWMVIFYDEANNPICRTDTYWLDVRDSNPSNVNVSSDNTGAFDTGSGNTGEVETEGTGEIEVDSGG